MKAIDLNIFVELYNYDAWKGKVFLLFDESNEDITKKTLCKIDISGMRAVNFYMKGDPRTNTKILLYTTEYNGSYNLIEDIEWEERECANGERYFCFDLNKYLFSQRRVEYELCIAPKHRFYAAQNQKSFEKIVNLEKKGFWYRDNSFYHFIYAPGMVAYGEKRIRELVVEVFDDKFLESDTFQYCINGCRNITKLDKKELLKKILENDGVNSIQMATEELHIRLWKEPIGIVTVDYRPLGIGKTKTLCVGESNDKCLEVVYGILEEEQEFN